MCAPRTAWQHAIWPLRFTSQRRSHVSSVDSMNGSMTSMPALFTRMSIGPEVVADVRDRGDDRGAVRHVERPR